MYESDEVSGGMSVHIYHEFIKATLSKSLKAKLVYLFFFFSTKIAKTANTSSIIEVFLPINLEQVDVNKKTFDKYLMLKTSSQKVK